METWYIVVIAIGIILNGIVLLLIEPPENGLELFMVIIIDILFSAMIFPTIISFTALLETIKFKNKP